MNLLLVDDENYVIESMKKNVDFEACGVEGVFTANGMEQAKEIMQWMPIHIIVSDIVMPQGSGFDFIEWVREMQYETAVIFLTSYAEFDYAQKAIAFGSVDYLLKPIDFSKLKETILTAVDRVKKEQAYEHYRTESRKWIENKQLLQDTFWKDLLAGFIQVADISSEMQRRDLDYPLEECFEVIMISIQEQERGEIWDSSILYFVIRNVLGEMAAEYGFAIQGILENSCKEYLIIGRQGNGLEDGMFEAFQKWMQNRLRQSVWCGIANRVKLCEVEKVYHQLKDMWENTLSIRKRILNLDDFKTTEISYRNPKIPIWKVLLNEERSEEILVGARIYLEELEIQEMVTRDVLKKFRVDITQMIYTWLEAQEVKAHLLFTGIEQEQYYENALQGSEGAWKYVAYLLKGAVVHQRYINNTDSVVQQVKNYIDKHFCEDIRREELAELVYLNTDYLSRIFKKELGISISSYLLQKRVEEAKMLLEGSELPINAVSLHVGYGNFSYFTKMFRENTGLSPLEYRRVKNR